MTLPREAIPCRNPGFVRRGEAIYFSITAKHVARRPMTSLDDEAAALFDAMDGVRTVEELSTRFPGAMELIRAWDELGVIELVPPPAPGSFPRRVLVIEPHMDDAALSMGGALLHMRGRAAVRIVAVVGRSKATSHSARVEWDYFDLDAVTALRLEESRLACRVLQADFVTLDEEDLPVALETGSRPWTMSARPELEATVSGLLRATLDFQPTEVWLPLGIRHPDHVRVRKAGLLMLRQYREGRPEVAIRFYQDLPYATEVGPDLVASLRRSIMVKPEELVPCVEDISDVMETKIRLSRVYASQFKASAMGPKLLHAARVASGREGACHEISYEPRGELRDPVPEFDIGAVMRRCREVRKVRALETVGWDPATWERLGAWFDRADIEIHVRAGDVPASGAAPGGRLRVRPVAGVGGWMRALFGFPTPWNCLCIVPIDLRFRPGIRGLLFRAFLSLWPFPVLACGIAGVAEWIEYRPRD